MLVPDSKVVRGMLTRYASLRIALAEGETPERVRELEDVSYTLCVMMGTRSVRDAISAADELLVAEARTDGAQKPDGENGLPVPA
ncbi:DUF5133 domain-containing protein [Streptomyces chiangmaiensis]|uniref:DUF5133 domain-containing protein n=1 Tax=Streptomyces chiangmaiensis TaxID=766497 RepID=A0ABU7FCG1_9ACTN|nr:DUF5133 domain-containing protein [Streptomyces chiangmaiensis]MED7821865.1 DUF5133 domain-containing protein [Streptomyces chiangmaiensis]